RPPNGVPDRSSKLFLGMIEADHVCLSYHSITLLLYRPSISAAGKQIRSFRGSGEPVWVSALPSAGVRLGPDPRRALGPAATPAASTGRTRDRTRPMSQLRQKVLARAPSTRDPKRSL